MSLPAARCTRAPVSHIRRHLVLRMAFPLQLSACPGAAFVALEVSVERDLSAFLAAAWQCTTAAFLKLDREELQVVRTAPQAKLHQWHANDIACDCGL